MTKHEDLYPITHIFLSWGIIANKIFVVRVRKNSWLDTFLLIEFVFRKENDIQDLGAIMLLKYLYLSSSHCVKSVHIRSFSGPYFPAFGLNTDQKNSEYGHFSHIVFYLVYKHLKVVSVTFLLVCFVSLKESPCETRKMIFPLFRKLVLYLEQTNFNFSDVKTSWRHRMHKLETRNIFYYITWEVNTFW